LVRYCVQCRASFQALTLCPRDRQRTRADCGDPLLGHVLGDRYRVLERLAAGGMGQVYRAAHTRIASLFAVKVLYGDIAHDQTMRTRFQREAEAASVLQSRHIVRVVDFGESPDGLLYLVMEYLDGVSLESALARDGAMPPARVVSLARQIARGLAHAHERGVVHRDLKPANIILIDEDDEPEVARLLDFGIASIGPRSELTVAGVLMGTPEYMSPEQCAGAEVDARTDLYALGIMMHELLMGTPPFTGPDIRRYREQHTRQAPPELDAPPPLRDLVHRLLAKSPRDRPPSARTVLETLRAIAVSARASERPLRASLVPESVIGTAGRDRIREAIQEGVPAYNSGDHRRCAAIYRSVATALAAAPPREDTAIAVASRLAIALRRADASEDATRAAWDLRYGFDDLLQAAALPRSVAFIAGEIAAAAAIAAPRYGAGDLELVGDYYLEVADRLARALRQQGRESKVAEQLEQTVAAALAAGSGQRALAMLGQRLDAFRQGLSSTAIGNGTPFRAPSLSRGPTVEHWGHIVSQAISVGAPAYNRGDYDGCFRVYRHAAEQVLQHARAQPAHADIAALFAAATEQADREGADAGAWTLRHAFDSLLSTLAPRDQAAEI
jgi:serine/threonine-protein kinase